MVFWPCWREASTLSSPSFSEGLSPPRGTERGQCCVTLEPSALGLCTQLQGNDHTDGRGFLTAGPDVTKSSFPRGSLILGPGPSIRMSAASPAGSLGKREEARPLHQAVPRRVRCVDLGQSPAAAMWGEGKQNQRQRHGQEPPRTTGLVLPPCRAPTPVRRPCRDTGHLWGPPPGQGWHCHSTQHRGDHCSNGGTEAGVRRWPAGLRSTAPTRGAACWCSRTRREGRGPPPHLLWAPHRAIGDFHKVPWDWRLHLPKVSICSVPVKLAHRTRTPLPALRQPQRCPTWAKPRPPGAPALPSLGPHDASFSRAPTVTPPCSEQRPPGSYATAHLPKASSHVNHGASPGCGGRWGAAIVKVKISPP